MKKQDQKTGDVQTHIKELTAQVDDWKGKALRALADYQNLERRVAISRHEERLHAAEKILTDLLPVVDVLETTQAHLNDKGLELALKEFWKVLEGQGIAKLEVVGKPFNPHEMECVEVVDGEDDKVIEEVFPGFRLHDKIIRVAKVKVGKKEIDKNVEELAKEELRKGENI